MSEDVSKVLLPGNSAQQLTGPQSMPTLSAACQRKEIFANFLAFCLHRQKTTATRGVRLFPARRASKKVRLCRRVIRRTDELFHPDYK